MVDIVTSGTEFGDSISSQIDDGAEININFDSDSITGVETVDGITRINLDPNASNFASDTLLRSVPELRSEVVTGRYGGAVTLGHELGHYLFGYEDPAARTANGWMTLPSEMTPGGNVVLYENQLRAAFHIAPRLTYHGADALHPPSMVDFRNKLQQP